jgi:diaminohydroxyphosphoribosylaminopyrimidine deaminase/5-amino-6-(5-phosphoribosylamino)uracil reductase
VFTKPSGVAQLQGWANDGAEVVAVDDLSGMLGDLGRRRFTNVLIEGGAGLLGAFHDEKLIDEVHLYLAPKLIGGIDAKSPLGGLGIDGLQEGEWELANVERTGSDIHIQARKLFSREA